MGEPWNERLFSRIYPRLLRPAEHAGQDRIRRDLLAPLRGRVLEIGAGNGFNLPHYPSGVTELVLSEPGPSMRRLLRSELAARPPAVGSWEITDDGGEQLSFPDASFDAVVGTYVQCTVPDPARSLDEVHRVLRPGGSYVFLEHVRAPDGTFRARLQDLCTPVNRFVGAGCHPNRSTASTLRRSRLTVEELRHSTMPRAFPLVRPIILGTARR